MLRILVLVGLYIVASADHGHGGFGGPQSEQMQCDTSVDCTSKFQSAIDCLNAKKDEMKAKFHPDEKKKQFVECLTKNQCVDPETLPEAKCGKAFAKQELEKTKQCAKDAFPNVNLPEMSEDDIPFSPEALKNIVKGALKISCKDASDKGRAAGKCIKDLFKNADDEAKKADMKEAMKGFAECFKPLNESEACKCQFGKSFAQIGQCVCSNPRNASKPAECEGLHERHARSAEKHGKEKFGGFGFCNHNSPQQQHRGPARGHGNENGNGHGHGSGNGNRGDQNAQVNTAQGVPAKPQETPPAKPAVAASNA